MSFTYASPPAVICPEWAFSSESASVVKHLKEIRKSRQETISFGLPRELSSEAIELQKECAAPNWDGYEALPITNENLEAALQFTQLLPEGIEPPALVPEPSGLVGFLWTKGPGLSLSATATPDGTLVYAGILGKRELSGQVPINDQIPNEITLALFEFFRKT